MAEADIGCSLAEAAESAEYSRYLQEAAHTPNSLHVVYINTSLRTKATADHLVPTITCTSSNVVQTVLQGFAQVSAADKQALQVFMQPCADDSCPACMQRIVSIKGISLLSCWFCCSFELVMACSWGMSTYITFWRLVMWFRGLVWQGQDC
jgi:hypothetical protein